VSYGTDDAEASDAANGVAWKEINGIKVAWEEIALSADNKLYVYNHGNDRIKVDMAIGLEGA
jgi:hypothetical protein